MATATLISSNDSPKPIKDDIRQFILDSHGTDDPAQAASNVLIAVGAMLEVLQAAEEDSHEARKRDDQSEYDLLAPSIKAEALWGIKLNVQLAARLLDK